MGLSFSKLSFNVQFTILCADACPVATFLLLVNNNIFYTSKRSDIATKQKHPGCKKSAIAIQYRPIRNSIVNRCIVTVHMRLISAEAKKLLILSKVFN